MGGKPHALRLEELEGRMNQMESEIRKNTRITMDISAKVEDMHDVFITARGGFQTIETLGRIAKPFLYTVALFTAMYAFWKTGKWEFPAP